MQQFFAERLLKAAQRGLWAEPSAEVLQGLKEVYLESEGLLEGRGSEVLLIIYFFKNIYFTPILKYHINSILDFLKNHASFKIISI